MYLVSSSRFMSTVLQTDMSLIGGLMATRTTWMYCCDGAPYLALLIHLWSGFPPSTEPITRKEPNTSAIQKFKIKRYAPRH